MDVAIVSMNGILKSVFVYFSIVVTNWWSLEIYKILENLRGAISWLEYFYNTGFLLSDQK